MNFLLEQYKNRKAKILIACTVCLLLIAALCSFWAVFGEQREVTVSVDGEKTSYTTFKHTVGEFLAAENILVGEQDTIDIAMEAPLKDADTITIKRAKEVEVNADGETYHLSALDATVGDALEQVNVVLDENDTVTPAADTELTVGMSIQVDRIEEKEEVRETEIAIPLEKRSDASMSLGTEKVIQEGSAGKQTDTYRVTYCNGKVTGEELLDTKVEEPVAKVVATGSYEVASRSGSQSEATTEATASEATTEATTSEAEVAASAKEESQYAPNGMKYTKTLSAKSTAYTHDGSKTKMGTECRVGAIAVDPSVIPLGSKLYVEGYGYCTAEDTGGKIKGNRIDVFLDTEAECNTWGVKTVTVYVLE